MPIDEIRLNFDQGSLWILNICLAVIMFGIALNLETDDFKNVFRAPRAAIAGIVSQFVVLPVLTFLFILVVEPYPSFALGMILVASCPGGNISNFMTHLAKGNTALSISLTAVSTTAAILLTPLNLQLWGSLYEPTSSILREVDVSFIDVFNTVALILGLPLILGMIIRKVKPKPAQRISNWLKPVSMIIFIGFVVAALGANWNYFVEYIHLVILLVFVHNILGLSAGFYVARAFGLEYWNRKTLAIETGIQNSGLGLLLIFTFFDGLGGMAIIAAWWGIWHIISGLGLSFYWSRSGFSKIKQGI